MTNKKAGKEDPLEGLKTVSNWKDLVSSTGKRPWGRWNHQYRAFGFIQSYLENPKVDRSKAALIRTPTGTGKTGIMALVANFLKIKGHILIIVPSRFLTFQIAQALNYGFWLAAGRKPRQAVRPAVVFFPSGLDELLQKLRESNEKAVLICTNQSLAKLFKDVSREDLLYEGGKDTRYGKLKEAIDLVLVDEGHREPARDWSRAVRWLSKPTILFSATPYRNDLHMFHVGQSKEHRFVFKYQEATKARIIREIAFVPGVQGYQYQPELFASLLHRFYYGKFQRMIPEGMEKKEAKVIIRCEHKNAIEKITAKLRELENAKRHKGDGTERVIAVHDLYAHTGYRASGCFGDAPTDEGIRSRAIFWVHQHKLTEGLDDPRFCLVAFYQPFGNARSLVQQLGRVIRNPAGSRDAKAWVFSDPAFELEKQWEGYLSYESYEKNIIGSEDIIAAFRDSLPKWFYYSRDFRVSPDFANADMVRKDVRLKPSVRVFKLSFRITEELLRKLSLRLSEELEEQNMVEAYCDTWPDDKKQGSLNSLLVHWQIEQTPYLERTGFFETRLFPTFLCYRHPYLFYHGCTSLAGCDEQHSYHPAEQQELEHLIPQPDFNKPEEALRNTLKQISLTNTDVGNETVRKRTIGGLSLDRVGQMLNDHFHVINSVLATRDSAPIYVGFSTGTVSEPTRDMLSIEEYKKWTEEIQQALENGNIQVNRGLSRYARPVPAPATAKAVYLLLDLSDFLQEYEPIVNPHLPYREKFTSESCEVTNKKFTVRILNVMVSGEVRYTGKRFHLTFDKPLKGFIARHSRNKLGAESFLSQGASIQVVTEDGLVYVDGQFFNPQNLWGENRISNLDIFAGSPFLNGITKKEKGLLDKVSHKLVLDEDGLWAKKSVFRAMIQDRFYTELHFHPDIIICEDLGDERADFIAVDLRQKKIAQIHCKNGGDSMGALTAGKLHEVVSQVQKNLGFFEPSARIGSDLETKWKGKWEDKVERIYKAPTDCAPGQTINEIRSLLRSNSVQKEVWVVMGNTYAPTEIPAAIVNNKPPRHSVIQMLYLLHACVSSVQMVGAQLKVITGTADEPTMEETSQAVQMGLEAVLVH